MRLGDEYAWWRDAIRSDDPMVTTMDWKHVGGKHIVMNTAALLLLIEEGSGSSWAQYVRENIDPDI